MNTRMRNWCANVTWIWTGAVECDCYLLCVETRGGARLDTTCEYVKRRRCMFPYSFCICVLRVADSSRKGHLRQHTSDIKQGTINIYTFPKRRRRYECMEKAIDVTSPEWMRWIKKLEKLFRYMLFLARKCATPIESAESQFNFHRCRLASTK